MSQPAIIIPVHNRRATTLACLRHLQDQGAMARFAVTVVDDGSTDGTSEAIHRDFPSITVIAGSGDLWWTGAVRLGSEQAFAAGAAAVIWLNDDCLPEPGALDKILAHLSAHSRSLVAPSAIDMRTGQSVATGFRGRSNVVAGPNEVAVVDGVSGFCVAVPREAWRALGPLDPVRFPHYAGETAYTLRATRAGYAVTLLGSARVQLTDHHPLPASPAALRQPHLTLAENYRAIFLGNKSPFRLATQRHLLRLKYGTLTGSILITLRTVLWYVRFLFRI